jgi:anti-sigma regulatory factor (Ser/Thr protein kinase)
LENLSAVRGFVRTAASELGLDADRLADVLLAVDEAATNTVVHGYRECGGNIEVSVERTTEALLIRLRDEADPFDPHCMPRPDVDAPLERRRPGGLGVHLMRMLVDEVHHRTLGAHGNELTLVKRFRPMQ